MAQNLISVFHRKKNIRNKGFSIKVFSLQFKDSPIKIHMLQILDTSIYLVKKEKENFFKSDISY